MYMFTVVGGGVLEGQRNTLTGQLEGLSISI